MFKILVRIWKNQNWVQNGALKIGYEYNGLFMNNMILDGCTLRSIELLTQIFIDF